MDRSGFRINLLLVDDHQLMTDGLAKLLETEPTIGEIHLATNGQQAVEIALMHDIDCIIMDINMPVLNGLAATKRIRKEKPSVKIIVASMLSDAPIVNKLLRAGANAFINKDTGKAELLTAIDKVMSGQTYISPSISTNLFIHLTDRNVATTDGPKHLTAREIEILRHIANGLTNQAIAGKLFLSPVTVDTHRKNMLAKLQVKNTAALIKYAADHGLLE
jgi:DNA-binding NarL/FixJ family response regulator